MRKRKWIWLAAPVILLAVAGWFAGREAASWRPRLVSQVSRLEWVAVSPDGNGLALASPLGSRVVDIRTGGEAALPAANWWSYSPNGNRLLGRRIRQAMTEGQGSQDLLIVDVPSRKVLKIINRPTNTTTRAGDRFDDAPTTWTPNGDIRTLTRGRIETWRGPNFAFSTVRSLEVPDRDDVTTGQFSADGTLLIVATINRYVHWKLAVSIDLYDAMTAKRIYRLATDDLAVYKAQLSPLRSFLALSNGATGKTTIISCRTRKSLWNFPTRRFAFTADDKIIVTGELLDKKELVVRDAADGAIMRRVTLPGADSLETYATTPDGLYVVIGSERGWITRVRIR